MQMVGKKRRKEQYPTTIVNTKRTGSDLQKAVKKFKKPEALTINTQGVSRAKNGGMVRGPKVRRSMITKSIEERIPRPRK